MKRRSVAIIVAAVVAALAAMMMPTALGLDWPVWFGKGRPASPAASEPAASVPAGR